MATHEYSGSLAGWNKCQYEDGVAFTSCDMPPILFMASTVSTIEDIMMMMDWNTPVLTTALSPPRVVKLVAIIATSTIALNKGQLNICEINKPPAYKPLPSQTTMIDTRL
ncbi:hypothetical protein D3C87_1227470 [compost metagenome]